MIKKISYLLVILFIISCFTGCGNEDQPLEIDSSSGSLSSEQVEQSEQAQSSEESIVEETEEDWGVTELIVSGKNDKLTTAYIKFPALTGIVKGTGKIAYQTDATLVILDAERKTGSPILENDTCDNIFPAYFEQTKKIIDGYRQMDHDNFEFHVTDKEVVTINGYDMCKYIGKHTFTVDGEDKEMNFVAYATKLNGNGACVYWMVLDESEDQSLTKTIEEYADKMATTLSE